MVQNANILYGAYGANRDPEMLKAITGSANLIGRFAIFKDVELCIQRFEQIPDTVAPTAPVPLSPRAVMVGTWGKESKFETYVIRHAEGSSVEGKVYELTTQERALVAEWEMIEFGWYKEMDVTAVLEDHTQIIVNTEGLNNSGSVDRVVDGMSYPTYLNDPADMFKIARRARDDFLTRHS